MKSKDCRGRIAIIGLVNIRICTKFLFICFLKETNEIVAVKKFKDSEGKHIVKPICIWFKIMFFNCSGEFNRCYRRFGSHLDE